jgi:hypothetical protein
MWQSREKDHSIHPSLNWAEFNCKSKYQGRRTNPFPLIFQKLSKDLSDRLEEIANNQGHTSEPNRLWQLSVFKVGEDLIS